MQKEATISDNQLYRYKLSRTWDSTKPTILFIGLNPSIADETIDDPTITRCINYAKAWGYGTLLMTNLLAFRSTYPKDIYLVDDPIGDENDNEQLKDFSVVTFKHKVNGKDLGTIGIIGPKRMDYSKVISVMKYINQKLNGKSN